MFNLIGFDFSICRFEKMGIASWYSHYLLSPFGEAEVFLCSLLLILVFFEMNTKRVLCVFGHPRSAWLGLFERLSHYWRGLDGRSRKSYPLKNRHLNWEFIFSSGSFLALGGLIFLDGHLVQAFLTFIKGDKKIHV